MKPIARLLVAALLVAGAGWYLNRALEPPPEVSRAPLADEPAAGERTADADADSVRQAFEARVSGQMRHVAGRVQRILADDRDGSPHQRFIIVTDYGQTLLIAHNLDLAPRLAGLAEGDLVRVYGQYEWNAQGGVMHWTHDDPQGEHPAGHIEWQGRRYQ